MTYEEIQRQYRQSQADPNTMLQDLQINDRFGFSCVQNLLQIPRVETFWNNLSPGDRETIFEELKSTYSAITRGETAIRGAGAH
jgi:hypothetical protein